MLRWRPGSGYSFSDMPAKHRGVFPHVFHVHVAPEGSGSIVTIDVRGRWQPSWIPRRIWRLWLVAVAAEHARLLRRVL
jgi:hypothetical protein